MIFFEIYNVLIEGTSSTMQTINSLMKTFMSKIRTIDMTPSDEDDEDEVIIKNLEVIISDLTVCIIIISDSPDSKARLLEAEYSFFNEDDVNDKRKMILITLSVPVKDNKIVATALSEIRNLLKIGLVHEFEHYNQNKRKELYISKNTIKLKRMNKAKGIINKIFEYLNDETEIKALGEEIYHNTRDEYKKWLKGNKNGPEPNVQFYLMKSLYETVHNSYIKGKKDTELQKIKDIELQKIIGLVMKPIYKRIMRYLEKKYNNQLEKNKYFK